MISVKVCSNEANMLVQHHATYALLDTTCWPRLNTMLVDVAWIMLEDVSWLTCLNIRPTSCNIVGATMLASFEQAIIY